jgi:hypothetical protein
MFIFNIILVIFWWAISLKWAQWAYESVMNEPYLSDLIFFLAYGGALFHGIKLLISKIDWFQLIAYALIFKFMWLMGYI